MGVVPVAAHGQRQEPGRPHAAQARGLAEHLMALRKFTRGTQHNTLLLQAAAPKGAHIKGDVVAKAPSDLRPAPRGGRAG
eukprot:14721550-Alexandrium_andersonii.AAC.1